MKENTHTHTHMFNGPLSSIWILLKQETVSGSGISWAICKSAPRSRQMTTPAPHHSVFTGRMTFLPPNQQRQSTEGLYLSIIVLYGLLTTKVIPCQLNKCRDVYKTSAWFTRIVTWRTSICTQLTVTWTTQTSLWFKLVLQNIIWARLC